MELEINDYGFTINKLNNSFGIDKLLDSLMRIACPTQDVEDPQKIIQKEGDVDPYPWLSTENSLELDIPLMEMSDSELESEFDLFDLPSENEDACMFSPLMSKIAWTPDWSPTPEWSPYNVGYDSWDEISIPDEHTCT